jgi:tryptophanyl-tRNA synthetase
MEAYFAPMRKKRAELVGDMDYVRDVLERSARKARERAGETMREVRRKMGID